MFREKKRKEKKMMIITSNSNIFQFKPDEANIFSVVVGFKWFKHKNMWTKEEKEIFYKIYDDDNRIWIDKDRYTVYIRKGKGQVVQNLNYPTIYPVKCICIGFIIIL